MKPTARVACAINSWCFDSPCQIISGTLICLCDQQFVISFLYLCLKLECTYLDAFAFWLAACRPTFYCHESVCSPGKSCTINSNKDVSVCSQLLSKSLVILFLSGISSKIDHCNSNGRGSTSSTVWKCSKSCNKEYIYIFKKKKSIIRKTY